MPSTMGNNLVDGLVPMIDELRGDLNGSMGTRQHDVHIIRRRWPSGRVGEDSDDTQPPTIVTDLVILPRPSLVFPSASSVQWSLSPVGRDIAGEALLMEVSLTYAEEELTGGLFNAPGPDDEDFYYKLVDIQGQGSRPKFFVLAAPPVADRVKTLGWIIALKSIGTPPREVP